MLPRVWISSASAAKVVERDFRLIHVPSDYFYLVRILSDLLYHNSTSESNLRIAELEIG